MSSRAFGHTRNLLLPCSPRQHMIALKRVALELSSRLLEAFSDGVIAIIITIMTIELKVPHGADFRVLLPLWLVFMSYVLSFVYVGIY
jgi:uncharacterized membrane protein